MKNQILNMGIILSSAQQKQVFGGKRYENDGWCDHSGQCSRDSDCPDESMGNRKGYCKSVSCDGDPRKYCDLK